MEAGDGARGREVNFCEVSERLRVVLGAELVEELMLVKRMVHILTHSHTHPHIHTLSHIHPHTLTFQSVLEHFLHPVVNNT